MIFRGKAPDLTQKESNLVGVFPGSISEKCNFSETTCNFRERFEVTRVKTSNIVFIILLDHQAAHIYTYMGQNILMILRVFGTNKLIYVTKAKIVELWK